MTPKAKQDIAVASVAFIVAGVGYALCEGGIDSQQAFFTALASLSVVALKALNPHDSEYGVNKEETNDGES